MLRNLVVISTLTFTVLMASGCPVRHSIEQDGYFSRVLNPEDIPGEIRRAEKLAIHHPDKNVRAQAHLRLAMLNLDYRNPRPDYLRSLKELKWYMSLSPNGEKIEEARSLAELLSTYENLLKENDERRRVMEKLKGQNELLGGENERMRETITELEYLDLQLEKKRKQIR